MGVAFDCRFPIDFFVVFPQSTFEVRQIFPAILSSSPKLMPNNSWQIIWKKDFGTGNMRISDEWTVVEGEDSVVAWRNEDWWTQLMSGGGKEAPSI